MSLHTIIAKSEKILSDNSPLILTGIGAAGVLTTAYLTGKASIKASKLVDEATIDLNSERYTKNPTPKYRHLEKQDIVKLVWKEFIPPAASAGVTLTAIILANRIGTRRAAALAAAYTVSERAFTEYREKVVEKIGPKKETAIRDEIAVERAKNNPAPATLIIGDGKVPCLDSPTGQWWECDLETIRKAENDINFQLINQDTATQTDYFSLVGLQQTSTSCDMGWHVDKKMNLHISHGIAENGPYKGKPYISVDYAMIPMRHWKGSL